MPDIIKISELDEALALADAAEFPFYQDNGGQNTTYKAPITQIGAKIVEGLTYQGINLPAGAGNKTVENSLNYLIGAVGGDPNGNISDSYDPAAAYVKGDLCIYENVLYICTAPTTGTFDPSKWTATTIDNVIGSLSQLTTTDKSSLVGAANEVNNRLGNRLVGAWTADTSTANLQILTDDIDVTAGTYLIIMSYPDTSANFVSVLYNRATGGVYDNCYMSGGSWTSKEIITAFSGNGKLCIASAQGATCNFTNKIRGSIRAIKLSNLY